MDQIVDHTVKYHVYASCQDISEVGWQLLKYNPLGKYNSLQLAVQL